MFFRGISRFMLETTKTTCNSLATSKSSKMTSMLHTIKRYMATISISHRINSTALASISTGYPAIYQYTASNYDSIDQTLCHCATSRRLVREVTKITGLASHSCHSWVCRIMTTSAVVTLQIVCIY